MSETLFSSLFGFDKTKKGKGGFVQAATIEDVKRLCAILDEQDEEFKRLKEQIGEIETRIEKMGKNFTDFVSMIRGESAKKRYHPENGVSGK